MLNATETLDRQYQEMRQRVLSLAADLDRIQHAPGGDTALRDPRLVELHDCVRIVLDTNTPDRAERVQLRLSDRRGDPRDA
jgi:hypothetical protein